MDYNKYETLLFEKRDRVLTVTLNRPEKAECHKWADACGVIPRF